ncbi:MAG TPA: CocE/NonD family hydrolase, partial [Vicinamibacteria bacterium]
MLPAARRFVVAFLLACAPPALAQQGALSPADRQKRLDTEKELQSLAVVDRKLMVPMRDGVRLATDVYRPKGAASPVPIVFVRTPYNFNFWDIANGVPADMSRPLAAVKRGYAYVVQNERGHFFSEGHYEILGAPLTDGYDMLEWLQKQPWSSGKVGTTGCSSTAEYQMAVAAQGHPALAALNAQGFGAGVGRVGPYWEQGNWDRGGALQMLFVSWIHGEQNQVRPTFPRDTSQADLVRASMSFDLAQHQPPVDWDKALRHLPVQDILKAIDGPPGIFADPMPVP